MQLGLFSYLFDLVLFIMLLFTTSFASTLKIEGNNVATVYGFIGYEGGYFTKASPTFFKSNTSFNGSYVSKKASFSSRSQLRIGFRFRNLHTDTAANVTVDSWPNDNFNLMLAYVRQPILRHLYVVFGKDWSLVNQRYFHYSSYCFRPYPVGFQGSKRNTQFRVEYSGNVNSVGLYIAVSAEDRNQKNGVVVGKNLSSTGKIISDSKIRGFRKDLPAIAGNFRLFLPTKVGKPSQIMAFYEVFPVYLEYLRNESYRDNYLYSFACQFDIRGVSIIGQYIHSDGLTGVNGIKGNNLKTFSYIYVDNNLVERRSDAFGLETVFRTGIGDFSIGFTSLNYSNKHESGNYFLKNEVKRAKTEYFTALVNITKLERVFFGFYHVETKYSVGNLTGKFSTASGNQMVFGYRMFF